LCRLQFEQCGPTATRYSDQHGRPHLLVLQSQWATLATTTTTTPINAPPSTTTATTTTAATTTTTVPHQSISSSKPDGLPEDLHRDQVRYYATNQLGNHRKLRGRVPERLHSSVSHVPDCTPAREKHHALFDLIFWIPISIFHPISIHRSVLKNHKHSELQHTDHLEQNFPPIHNYSDHVTTNLPLYHENYYHLGPLWAEDCPRLGTTIPTGAVFFVGHPCCHYRVFEYYH